MKVNQGPPTELFKQVIIIVCSVLFLFSCSEEEHAVELGDDFSAWPQIALINEVWYKTGEQYVHPSFEYAGTGFLLEHGNEIYAITAKHILWIAKPNVMETVVPDAYLEKWLMHPKGTMSDSVVITGLVNSDFSEELQGKNSTIQDRDWLVFTTKEVSPNIHPLKTQFRSVSKGEKIYFTGCPYSSDSCYVRNATVLSAKGNRIVFSNELPDESIGGASGSPLIDENGFLVGILGGTSVSPEDGSPALYGMNTRYLKKVLDGDPTKNYPLHRIDDFLLTAIDYQGVDFAITKFQGLISDPENYYKYTMPPEQFNNVANNLLFNEQPADALKIVELSMLEHPYFSRTYSLKGKILVKTGNTEEAKMAFKKALDLWKDNEEAIAGLDQLED